MDPTHPEIDESMNPASAAPGASDAGGSSGAEGSAGGSSAGGGWSGPGSGRWSSTASASAQAWLGQLQAIMDDIATQSAPVAREIGAKAAELAALAAERAGPLAQRAAEATQQVSVRVAERSRGIAADLRRAPGDGGPTASSEPEGRPVDDMGQGEGSSDTTAPVGPTV